MFGLLEGGSNLRMLTLLLRLKLLIQLNVTRCREVFLDFEPVAVSKLNEKKITTPGSPASSLLSELKLRAIIENARETCKVWLISL